MHIKNDFGPNQTRTKKGRTFGDLVAIFFQSQGNGDALKNNRSLLLNLELSDVPIETFPEFFEKFMQRLKTEPSKGTGRFLAPATVNRQLDMVRTVFNLAVQREIIEKNPITKQRFPNQKEHARDRYLSPEEEGKLLDALENEAPHLVPMVRYALQVPCRKGELVRMRKAHLDLTTNLIRVPNGTTKNTEGLDKPIPPNMRDYFHNLPEAADHLFYRKTATGKYLPLGDFKKSWVRCLYLAGIDNFRFHDTRHIAATRLVNNGTPERVVMAIAGWKTNMLSTYYHRSSKALLDTICW